LFLSFSEKNVNADGGYGPGFYFEDGGGGSGDTPPVSDDIELIATGFLKEVHQYDQDGNKLYDAPYYNNGDVIYGLQMELYLPLDDIDDKFVDVAGITQFYARFTNSELEYYNNNFYKVIYVTDVNAIPDDANYTYFSNIDLVYNWHETMSGFEASQETNAVDVTNSYNVYNYLGQTFITVDGQYLGQKSVYLQVHTSTLMVPINDPLSNLDFYGGYYTIEIEPTYFDSYSWSAMNLTSGSGLYTYEYHSNWSDIIDQTIVMNIG